MKSETVFILLLILFTSCNREKELIENRWIILDGTYKSGPITFGNGERYTDTHELVPSSLIFFENHRANLPGIGCKNIYANWEIIQGKITFTIDSSRYEFDRMAEHATELKAALSDSTQTLIERDPKIFTKPKHLAGFSNAMKIYGELFDFKIVNDTLILKSPNVIIRAERVRTLVELLEENL